MYINFLLLVREEIFKYTGREKMFLAIVRENVCYKRLQFTTVTILV